MTTNMLLALAVLASLIVGALTLYASTLWLRVWREARQRTQDLAVAERKRQQRHGEFRESIVVLARAQLQGQVSRTEAAIRIATLARGLQPDDAEQQLYRPFTELATATAHIPILDAWRALPSKDQDRFDNERSALEAAHAEVLDQAAQGLLEHPALAQFQSP